MRIVYFLLSLATTIFLVWLLNSKLLLPVAFGKLLSPQHGLWQNAESLNENFSDELNFPNLKAEADVYFDDRLVPHVFAEEEEDAWFIEGYLHAKFRLWQMELQVFAAGGRAAELVGEKALEHDREFRRLGMVYAAENALRGMEKNDTTLKQCNAYTAGVNAYINSLDESQLPVEYKLLDIKPELWTNLKSALFLKYMSFDLAGFEKDFELTNARNYFSAEDFAQLYPSSPDSIVPVVPADSGYVAPKLQVKQPLSVDYLYFKRPAVEVEETVKPPEGIGSNSWAVSGSRTESGYPIFCNDLHLKLNLPSLWYEIQITTPSINAYGVSFPGSPGVILGFNDSCSFGFTNAGRDVRDYYEISFRDGSRKEYLFNGKWMPTDFRIEEIKIAGAAPFFDTVVYTHIGPVMFDTHFGGKRTGNTKNYAVRWNAHDASNELLFFNKLYRANNYSDFTAAIQYMGTPGQNIAFVSKHGDIALHEQGVFPAKWKGQGDFIMPGLDSTYLWQGMIPADENPFMFNPARGFVSSANQLPADTTYPYYLGWNYPVIRGRLINRSLASMQKITVEDMMALQTDNYNLLAEMTVPYLLRKMNQADLSESDLKYVQLLRDWDYRNEAASQGAIVFDVYWKKFMNAVYGDEFARAPSPIEMPSSFTLVDALKRDSLYKFFDNIETRDKETAADVVTQMVKESTGELQVVESEGKMKWSLYRVLNIDHLLKLPAFSRKNINIGGNPNCINATTSIQGPSCRMIVHLAPTTQAFGIYPGGQNGNPGSIYYDNFIDMWSEGKYYRLWVMKKSEMNSDKVKWTMHFRPGVSA